MRVLAIDSLDYGWTENLDLSDPDVQLEQLRLPCRAGERLRHLLEGVDYVFHLAAEKHNQSINSPCRVLDANVMGTYELLSAAAGAGVKKIVFTSSLYVYGRMSAPPMSEDEVTAPQTVYGISKLSGEELCRHFYVQRGMPAVCLRLFFVYGPRQYSGLGYKSVIVKNFDRMLKGHKPVIYGDGNQELDYIYVDDAVAAMLLALSAQNNFEVFNVGNGVGVSINDLTSLMMEVAGAKTGSEFGPADSTRNSSRVASTKRFEDRFGLQSRVPLAEGLRRTFEYMTSSERSHDIRAVRHRSLLQRGR